MTVACYECGEPLHPEQEWRLRPELEPGEEATVDDWIHKDCMSDYREKLEYKGDGE